MTVILAMTFSDAFFNENVKIATRIPMKLVPKGTLTTYQLWFR